MNGSLFSGREILKQTIPSILLLTSGEFVDGGALEEMTLGVLFFFFFPSLN